MLESLLGGDPLSVVINEHPREQVQGVFVAEPLGLRLDEFHPGLDWMPEIYSWLLS